MRGRHGTEREVSLPREPRTRRRVRTEMMIGAGVAAAVIVSLAAVIASQLDARPAALTAEQRVLILKLQSVLLHDSPRLQYARVSLQPDDRGYVVGIGDFATADGSVLKVVDAYTARVGTNVLARDYGTTLRQLAETGSPDTSGLEGFPDAWRSSSLDPIFQQAQDNVLEASYLEPAIAAAQAQQVRTPLGIAVFFDTLLQHGEAGPDGLATLVIKTDRVVGRSANAGSSEHEWVTAFLDIRAETLRNPAEPRHQRLWPLTTGRVTALTRLAEADAWDLRPPVLVNAYGLTHRLDADPPEIALPSLPPAPTAPDGPASPTSPAPTRSTTTGTGTGTGTATSPAASSPPPSSPQLPMQGYIVGIDGLCLDLDGAVPDPGRHVKTWMCNFTAAQYWSAETDGTLRVMGVCLQPQNGSGLPGTPLEVQGCLPGDPSQQWQFQDGRVRHTASGRCMATPDDTAEMGIQVVLATCGDRPSQYWTLPQ